MRSKSAFAILVTGIALLGVHGQERTFGKNVRIGVFGLFHPARLVISPLPGKPLVASLDGKQVRVAASSSESQVNVRLLGPEMEVSIGTQAFHPRLLEVVAEGDGAATFQLTVPDKIQRKYRGTLSVTAQRASLSPVVTMDVETAVASIVAAEYSAGTPVEALKAQAVVSRSYLVAGGGRHGKGFDFCDTTHCQFLRQPPEDSSPAAKATRDTAGLVLLFQNAVVPAMYSASCGGRTYSLASLGIKSEGYPYYAVECEYCKRNPESWVRTLTKTEAGELGPVPSEAARLKLVRRLGWTALPSNSYSETPSLEPAHVEISGVGRGHGIGLCQRGAAEMARRGEDFQTILRHYYPNTTLKRYPASEVK
jgi:stage II sporulation protein D